MESKKWEEMNKDCLMNIFGRVGIESLALDVPFVCKSWYNATLNPLCWQFLIFPKHLNKSRFPHKDKLDRFYDPKGLSSALVKGVVSRSQRCATQLALPDSCTKEDLIFVSEECPALKFLSLFTEILNSSLQRSILPSIISKWKNLESLELKSEEDLKELIVQISLHCKNFVELSFADTPIYSDDAHAIVTQLPNIKRLVLTDCILEKSDLVMILKGCKNLVHFDVSCCSGIDSRDEEIWKLASHITTFMCTDNGFKGNECYDYNFESDGYDNDEDDVEEGLSESTEGGGEGSSHILRQRRRGDQGAVPLDMDRLMSRFDQLHTFMASKFTSIQQEQANMRLYMQEQFEAIQQGQVNIRQAIEAGFASLQGQFNAWGNHFPPPPPPPPEDM